MNQVVVISNGTESLRIPAARLEFIFANGNYSNGSIRARLAKY
jgi:hypothetical protein